MGRPKANEQRVPTKGTHVRIPETELELAETLATPKHKRHAVLVDAIRRGLRDMARERGRAA